MIESWDALIDQLGGTKTVSEGLGLSASIVSGWRKRGIPSTRWVAICGLAETMRVPVNVEMLAQLASLPIRAPVAAEAAR